MCCKVVKIRSINKQTFYFPGWLSKPRRISYCNALSRTQEEHNRAPRNTSPGVEARLSQTTADQKKQTNDPSAPSHQPQQGLVQR